MRRCMTCGKDEFPHRYRHRFVSDGDGVTTPELLAQIRMYLKRGAEVTEPPWPAFYDMVAELCDRTPVSRSRNRLAPPPNETLRETAPTPKGCRECEGWGAPTGCRTCGIFCMGG